MIAPEFHREGAGADILRDAWILWSSLIEITR